MAAYTMYFEGGITDYDYPDAQVKESLSHLPHISNQ